MSKLTLISCIVLVTLMASLIVIPAANASVATWSKTFGGAANDRAFGLVKTQSGGYALLGTSTSFSSSGLITAYLVTTDAEGNLIWNQTYSGLGVAFPCCLIQTSDGGFAFAGYSYDLNFTGSINPWLARVDPAGNLQWNQTYSTLGNLIANLVQTSDGGYALVGYTTSSEDYIYSWLAKIDSQGNLEWKKDYGSSGDNEIFNIIQANDGGYFLGGYTTEIGAGLEDFWLLKTDSAGIAVWNKTYGGAGYDILGNFVQASDGGFALFGYSNSSDTNSEDFFIVKTDSSGTLQWSKTYGGSAVEEVFSGIQATDGGYVLVGVTTEYGSGHALMIKTDTNGILSWNKTYSDSAESVLYSIVQANDGGYAMAGYTNSTSTEQYFWFLKTDENGIFASPTTNPTATPTSSAVSPSPTVPEFSITFAVTLIGVCTITLVIATKRIITRKKYNAV